MGVSHLTPESLLGDFSLYRTLMSKTRKRFTVLLKAGFEMSDSQSERRVPRQSRLAQSVVAAVGGGCISEMARQMVESNNVPVWQVLLLTTSALIAGGMIVYTWPWHTITKKKLKGEPVTKEIFE